MAALGIRDAQAESEGQSARLAILSAIEFGERFAYSGVWAILIFYLIDLVAGPSGGTHLANLAGLHVAPASFQARHPARLASELLGLLTALFFVATILGGLIADRWLGSHRTIVAAGLIALCGYALLATGTAVIAGLVMVMMGCGAFKANVAAFVTRLYDGTPEKRDHGLRIFFMAAFFGMTAAPIICGQLGHERRWGWAFATAGLGMAGALAVYLASRRALGPGMTEPAAEPPPAAARLPRKISPRRVAAFTLFFAINAIALTGGQQVHNAYLSWASTHLDLRLFGRPAPAAWLLALDSATMVGALALSTRMWRAWSSVLPEPGPLNKIAFGCVLMASSYGCLAIAGERGLVPIWILLVTFHTLNSLGAANLFPVALSFIAQTTAPRSRSTFAGLLYLQFAFANLLAGGLGSWPDALSPALFWTLHAAIFTLAGLTMLGSAGWIQAAIQDGSKPRGLGLSRSLTKRDPPGRGGLGARDWPQGPKRPA
jgi:POT family proton-dependent oligopeptide transporter